MNEVMDGARREFASTLLQRNVLPTMMYIASASMPADEVSRGRALDRAKLADAIDAMHAFGAATKHAEEEKRRRGWWWRKSTISKKRKHKRVGKSSQANRAYRAYRPGYDDKLLRPVAILTPSWRLRVLQRRPYFQPAFGRHDRRALRREFMQRACPTTRPHAHQLHLTAFRRSVSFTFLLQKIPHYRVVEGKWHPVFSKRLKVAIYRRSLYIIIVYSLGVFHRAAVSRVSEPRRPSGCPTHPIPAGIRRERALSRRKESTSVSVSQVNPIVHIVWYRENGSASTFMHHSSKFMHHRAPKHFKE
jgi:hypothetical protein